MRPKIQ